MTPPVRTHLILFAVGVVGGCLSPSPSGVQEHQDTPLDLGLVESERVEIVQDWPFLARAKKQEDVEVCGNLGKHEIRIEEDGRQVRILSVDRAPRLTTHVLMLDTSASMTHPDHAWSRRKSRQMKAAARAYVEWMLADAMERRTERAGLEGSQTPGASSAPLPENGPSEKLMMATFDDDLYMRIPPTAVENPRVASNLIRTLYRMTGGYYTTLNDSLFRLTRYLAGSSERTVVILLSDGADSVSERQARDVEKIVGEANNVTIFSIGIGLGDSPYQRFLETIAEIGGGKYYWLRSKRTDHLAEPLKKKFREIRARLKGQLYASYVAEPSGEIEKGPKNVDDGGRARRNVRFESLNHKCEIPKDGYRSVRALRPPRSPSAGAGPGSSRLSTGADAEHGEGNLRLKVIDQVRDPDPLIRYAGEKGAAIWTGRTVEVIVPPFADNLKTGGAGRKPEDILHEWLVEGVLPERAGAGLAPENRESYYPIQQEMNGTTFLDHRGEIARALFTRFESYREWAIGKAASRIRGEYQDRIPAPEDPQERAKYEDLLGAVVRERLRQMAPEDYQQELVEWLGDLAARDLAFALERKEANVLLSEAPMTETTVDVVQRRWLRLHDWLLFPDRVRVLVPLELACDPGRDVCGFFRIVLPRLAELPHDPENPGQQIVRPESPEGIIEYEKAKVPGHPFGLMLMRWLLGMPVHPDRPSEQLGPGRARLADELREHWRVSSIEHHPEMITRWRQDEAEDRPACRQRVRVALRAEASDTRAVDHLRLEALVDGYVERAGEVRQEEVESQVRCQAGTARLRLVPRCFTMNPKPGPRHLRALLEAAGVAECG